VAILRNTLTIELVPNLPRDEHDERDKVFSSHAVGVDETHPPLLHHVVVGQSRAVQRSKPEPMDDGIPNS
jgi:hypothetical protein